MTGSAAAAAHRTDEVAAGLRTAGAHDASAAHIADAMVATWYEIDVALTPIIGSHAVVALYERSLQLTARTHPWLAGAHDTSQTLELAALQRVVARQSEADAVLGSDALLQTFCELLSSLIGPSLGERLLRSAWAGAAGGPATRERLR